VVLTRWLVLASIAWPLTLGAAAAHRVAHPPGERSVWVAIVYAAAHLVCHQKPERTLHTRDVAWPVCARCTGLYLAAPIGALLWAWRRPRVRQGALMLGLAAAPTVVTVVWEWAGLGMPPNLVRLVTAVPLGAAVAAVLVQVTTESGVVSKATR
jgi:uncharacterized membrane protein